MSVDPCPVLPFGVGRAGFLVFAVVVGLGVWLGRLQEQPPPAGVAAIGAALAVAAAALLLLRRRPGPLYAVVACAGITAVGGSRSANPVWFAMLLVVGWCALTGGRRVGLPLWLAVSALFTVQWVHFSPDQGWGAWLAGSAFMVLGGLLLRNQFLLVEQLRAAQAGLAAKARAQERNRISRDLHDVIAHSLTVSLLHVMSARLAVESDPDDAVRSLTRNSSGPGCAASCGLSSASRSSASACSGPARSASYSRASQPRTAPGGAELAALTAREREVLALIGAGRTNAEIAGALFVGEGTVKTHVNHVFAKLGLRDRAAAVIFALDHNLAGRPG